MICVHARIHTLNDGSLHTFWLTYMRTFYHITPCLSRSTVAIRSSARTPISGSCWFRLRPYRRSTGRQQRPLSEPCRRMAGRRRSALQRCLWAACSRRRRKSRTANHFRRWRSRCSAPTSTSICAKSAARWTVHRLSGTWSLDARTVRLAANVWRQRGGAQSCGHIRRRRLTSECDSDSGTDQSVRCRRDNVGWAISTALHTLVIRGSPEKTTIKPHNTTLCRNACLPSQYQSNLQCDGI